ncbi:histidine phosphatase family protein [Solibacillus sp. CAU 1738]|uniref:histidine phosphatase family protein n=1 Tax=Solibacillus sp. CAU 1738 TaxID=3140363 RepID=UPI00325FFC59
MTIVYFIRHAHSTYSPDELNRPLSEQGWQDTKRVTELMKSEEVDIVFSSPYKRAIQTVEGIATHFNKKIFLHDNLKERILSAVPVENFNDAILKVWENPNFSFEGGESNVTAQKRAVQVLQQILSDHKDENIVIGTHGNIFVLMMNYYDTKYNIAFWQQLKMPDIYKCTFEENQLVQVERLW